MYIVCTAHNMELFIDLSFSSSSECFLDRMKIREKMHSEKIVNIVLMLDKLD